MPGIGKPLSASKSRFTEVSMGRPEGASTPKDLSAMTDRQKELYLKKLTGFSGDKDIYVDGEKHNKMGKDEFLKLLTYQLQNQDPLKPMDQKEMSGQLAQFSQLEQLTNLNTKFDKINKNQQVESQFFGASFLGKEVVTTGNSMKLADHGEPSDVLFTLPKPAAKAMVRVFDTNNQLVGEVWKDNIGRGNQTITWDAITLDGQKAAKGNYRVEVRAWDQNTDAIKVASKVTGKVESVFFENGETVLKVDGKKVYLRDVDSFHTPGVRKNNDSTNLPIATSAPGNVELNKANNQQALNNYKRQVGTGITDVYDTE